MNATVFFAHDEEWLKKQPSMDPYGEGCERLLRQIDDWLERYATDYCDNIPQKGQTDADAFRRRLWCCWRFRWQPDWQEKKEYRIENGTDIATTIESGEPNANLVRDVVLAETVTQGEERAVTKLVEQYEAEMIRIAKKTSPRYAEDAWSDILGQSFRAPGQTGRLAHYEGQRPLYFYLKTMVIREVYRYVRKYPDETSGNPPEIGPDDENPDDIITREECERLLIDILREAIRRLTRRERLPLYYRFAKRMKLKDIGAILQIDKGNVSRRIVDVIRKLAEIVRNLIEERKQVPSVADCVELVFQDLRLSDLADLLIRALEELHEELEELQGGGD